MHTKADLSIYFEDIETYKIYDAELFAKNAYKPGIAWFEWQCKMSKPLVQAKRYLWFEDITVLAEIHW